MKYNNGNELEDYERLAKALKRRFVQELMLKVDREKKIAKLARTSRFEHRSEIVIYGTERKAVVYQRGLDFYRFRDGARQDILELWGAHARFKELEDSIEVYF